jgi:hypothetical protein
MNRVGLPLLLLPSLLTAQSVPPRSGNPLVSPHGLRIAFASTRDGTPAPSDWRELRRLDGAARCSRNPAALHTFRAKEPKGASLFVDIDANGRLQGNKFDE